jgi:hypothetical protein
MVKDLVLDIDLFPFLLDILECDLIVLLEEPFKFEVLNQPVLVLIDLLEQLQEIAAFQRHPEQIRHLRLHIVQRQEPKAPIHLLESVLRGRHEFQFLLYRVKHLALLDSLR